MPPSGDPYLDVPLNLGRKNIRLVTLQPGDASESIKCDLQSHALNDECPAYVALSYAWGAKERYDDIQINGSSFPVGRNLWHFLHQMRMQRRDALFWIDAISIDQANVLEQNHQVQMMRDIYTQACCVWIWLGEADDATMSDVAMQYLETRVALNGKDVHPKKLWNARKAKAVVALCDREYWRRIWIVQEVLLAKEAKILCGGQCVDWVKLQQLLDDLHAISDRGRSLHVVGVAAVLDSPAAIITRAKAQWNGNPQPLTLLLEQYHGQHSTDVRDKVYALHGLASDSDAIIIDYKIHPKELLVQIINHACSPQASKLDSKRSTRSMLGFAKLVRQSLQVFCDEEELNHHVSTAQRGSIASTKGQVLNGFPRLGSSKEMVRQSLGLLLQSQVPIGTPRLESSKEMVSWSAHPPLLCNYLEQPRERFAATVPIAMPRNSVKNKLAGLREDTNSATECEHQKLGVDCMVCDNVYAHQSNEVRDDVVTEYEPHVYTAAQSAVMGDLDTFDEEFDYFQ